MVGLREQVRAALGPLERSIIVGALRETQGNVSQAAGLLKLSRNGLRNRMAKLRIEARLGVPPAEQEEAAPSDDLKERMQAARRRVERGAIERALGETHQNITRAARLLKITRRSLQLKLKSLEARAPAPSSATQTGARR